MSGKVFALMGALEELASLGASALYSYFLFPLTLTLHPGFCFFFGSLLVGVALALTTKLHFDIKNSPSLPINEGTSSCK